MELKTHSPICLFILHSMLHLLLLLLIAICSHYILQNFLALSIYAGSLHKTFIPILYTYLSFVGKLRNSCFTWTLQHNNFKVLPQTYLIHLLLILVMSIMLCNILVRKCNAKMLISWKPAHFM